MFLLNYELTLSIFIMSFNNNSMDQLDASDVRNGFALLKEDIIQGRIQAVTAQRLQEEYDKCESLLNNMSISNNYKHFDEIVNVQQKVKSLQKIVANSAKNKESEDEVIKQMKNIFGYPYINRQKLNISPVSQIHSEDVVIPEQTIQQFFKKKEQQFAKKENSFKKILNSRQFQLNQISKDASKVSKYSKSRSNFKKDDEKQSKIKKLIEQHKRSVGKLQLKMKQDEELNDFQKNLLRQEKNRYLGKIQELEEEIEQLYRDNYRLRELQKTVKEPDSFNMSDLNQKSSVNTYQPYIIKTRNNDLQKINDKNYQKQEARKEKAMFVEEPQEYDILGDKLEKDKPLTAQQFFKKKEPKGLYAQKFSQQDKPSKKEEEMILKALLGDSFDQGQQNNKSFNRNNISMGSINNGNHFDTFHMARTLSFVNDSVINQSRNIVQMTGETSTRNKVAFFKKSLVLIRNSNFEIAFKKSQLNQKMDKVRIIIYLNNKTYQQKRVAINYQYQKEYFQFDVQEKLTHVQGQSQGREVIEITLISREDLNGVTDMHVEIGDSSYDLWLPINFIRFKQVRDYRMPKDTMEMTVLPDRQFASFGSIQELVPAMFGGRDETQSWAYLYGDSKFGSFPVKLTWRMRDLIIETSDKWLDFLGFVFHFFK